MAPVDGFLDGEGDGDGKGEAEQKQAAPAVVVQPSFDTGPRQRRASVERPRYLSGCAMPEIPEALLSQAETIRVDVRMLIGVDGRVLSATVLQSHPLIPDVADDRGRYGGSDDTSSCGTLKYVRIEFAGAELSPDNELNGLTLGGCGSGAELSYLQVHRGKDDGIEIFGGTVGYTVETGDEDDDDGFDEQAAIEDAARNNTLGTDPGLGSASTTEPDYVPTSADLAGQATPSFGDTSADYAGAFEPNAASDWTEGWTDYPEN